MSDIRKLMEAMEDISEGSEMIEINDSFHFELGDDLLIETGVVAVGPNAIIVEADQKTLDILREHFILEDFEELTESDIIDFPKDRISSSDSMSMGSPGKVVKFQKPEDLYTEFKHSKFFPGNMPRDKWLQAAMHFISKRRGLTDMNDIRSVAAELYHQHLQLDEELSTIMKYSGLKEPTHQRKQRGEVEPVDRTDYDIPAFLRKADRTGKKLSPELDALTDPNRNDESRYPHVSMRMGSDSDASSAGSYKMGETVHRPVLSKVDPSYNDEEHSEYDAHKELDKSRKLSSSKRVQGYDPYNSGEIDEGDVIQGPWNTVPTNAETRQANDKEWEVAEKFVEQLARHNKKNLDLAGIGVDAATGNIRIHIINSDSSGPIGHYGVKYILSPNGLYISDESGLEEAAPDWNKMAGAVGGKDPDAKAIKGVTNFDALYSQVVDEIKDAGVRFPDDPVYEIENALEEVSRIFGKVNVSNKDELVNQILRKMAADGNLYKLWDDVGDVDDLIPEAKYHGREVPLGKKMKGDVKKSKVYVRKPNGKVVKVNFGDKNMRIKKNSPSHRKSFRARHHCESPGPRWKARYWSCKSW